MTDFVTRMSARIAAAGSHLTVGLDPRIEALPDEFPFELGDPASEAAAAEAFCCEVVSLTAEHAAAFKLQSAFFEMWHTAGIAAYHRVAERAAASGALVIADVKRGDIGSTARAYARASFTASNATDTAFDAITVNPYFGSDGLEPFFHEAQNRDGGVFVLVKTSNPSSREFQDLVVTEHERPLYEQVARRVREWGEDCPGVVGAVVGATHGPILERLRSLMPETWFLIPGVGAQGASMSDAARAADAEKSRVLVNMSRGITSPWQEARAPSHWREIVAAAASEAKIELSQALDAR